MVIFLVKKVNVYVCFHNKNLIEVIKKNIKNNEIYVPLLIGTNGKDNYGFYSDDSGDNISYMNFQFSELTGLYWMSKNSDADIIGLCHYRRYFINQTFFGRLLNKEDILNMLQGSDIILSKGAEPLKGTNYETYPEYQGLFDEAYKIIKKDFPEYVESFNHVFHGYYPISNFNMFISSKEIIDKYCDWIFPILFKMYENNDLSSRPRVLGVISEYLFNVFIYHNNLKIKEVPLRCTDFKIKLRMFFIKNKVLRSLYKNVYYPYLRNKN